LFISFGCFIEADNSSIFLDRLSKPGVLSKFTDKEIDELEYIIYNNIYDLLMQKL
jgi:hypothetical protein